MKTYAAYTLNLAFIGGFDACIGWAEEFCSRNNNAVVKILKMRPQEDALIIGEVSIEGFRDVPDGRFIKLKRVVKAQKNGF